jgi:hypothetical protein
MGPLAVRPDRQGERLGSAMVQGGIEWLKSQGAATIGLETMPRTVDNIGFYSRLGLLPGHLTVTLVREAGRRIGALPERLGDDPSAVNARLDECRVLTDRLQPGVDFTRELALTRDLALGDTTLVRRGRRLVAFALWHSAPLAAGRPRDEVRLLKLAALDLEAFSALLDAVQAAAEGERLRRLSVRCQSAFGDAYAQLIRDGFRVHWTDLRMTLGGYPEAPVRQGIVMSNWEI